MSEVSKESKLSNHQLSKLKDKISIIESRIKTNEVEITGKRRYLKILHSNQQNPDRLRREIELMERQVRTIQKNIERYKEGLDRERNIDLIEQTEKELQQLFKKGKKLEALKQMATLLKNGKINPEDLK